MAGKFNLFLIKKFLFLSFFVFLVISISFLTVHVVKNSFRIPIKNEMNTSPEYVRIYYDFATISSVYQTYDFLNQDPDSVIFLQWDRTPNLEQKLAGRTNTFILKHFNGLIHSELDPTPVLEYYKNHPDSKFIIHSTSNWIVNLKPIIYGLPKAAIKEFHIYEDGSYASSLVTKQDISNGSNITEMNKIIHTDFKDTPVVFHMEDAEYLNSFKCLFDRRCLYVKNLYKNDALAKTSILDLKDKLNLNLKLKEEYFTIFDFDYKKYEKEMIHPFGIYTFGILNDYQYTKESTFLAKLLKGNLKYLVKDNDVKWYYKRHPYLYQIQYADALIHQKYPNIVEIPRGIPLEMFLLADIIPDYVAGYSSGIYLSFPKNSICAYIRRPKDDYMYIINRDHKIRPGRIFDFDDVNYSAKSKLKRCISKFLVFFQ